MAASDAKPFVIKNHAYRVYFPLLDADGDLVEGMAGLDSEVSKDGATFANCTNEATEILTIVHDVNDTTNAVTSSDATNQTTLNTLLNEIKTDYNAHRISTAFHDAADSTNIVTSADATDAATSVTLANEIKTDYNAHRSQADVHPHDDSANAVSSADATDEATCITLANEIKTDYNAHLTATAGSGMAYLDLTSTEMNADATAIVVKSSTTGAKTTPIVLYPMDVSEPSQGAPPAAPTPEEMMKYIYFKLRNKGLTTATEDAMYADDGTTKIMKATLSDNGTTFEKSEYVSGA
jgi:hypothetical protein